MESAPISTGSSLTAMVCSRVIRRRKGCPTTSFARATDVMGRSGLACGEAGLPDSGTAPSRTHTQKDGLATTVCRHTFMDKRQHRCGWHTSRIEPLQGWQVHDLYGERRFVPELRCNIVEDDHGSLWMTCSKGAFRVSKRELHDFAEGRVRSVTSSGMVEQHGLSSTVRDGRSCVWGVPVSGWPHMAGVDDWSERCRSPGNLCHHLVPPPSTSRMLTIDGKDSGRSSTPTRRRGAATSCSVTQA